MKLYVRSIKWYTTEHKSQRPRIGQGIRVQFLEMEFKEASNPNEHLIPQDISHYAKLKIRTQ